MKRIKLFIAALGVVAFGGLALAPTTNVLAIDPLAGTCADNPNSEICKSKNDNATSLIGTLINVLLFITGALSVVMLIVGGIFYVISSGDAGKVAKAKNTVMYSIVGLVISLVALAIVNWVLKIF